MENQITRILSTNLSLQMIEELSSNEAEILKLERMLGQKNSQVTHLHQLINTELQATISQNQRLKSNHIAVSKQLGDLRVQLTNLKESAAKQRDILIVQFQSARQIFTQQLNQLQNYYRNLFEKKLKEIQNHNKYPSKDKEISQTKSDSSIQTDNQIFAIPTQVLQRLQKLEATVLSLKQEKLSLQKQIIKIKSLYLSPSPQKSCNSAKSLNQEETLVAIQKAISTNFQNLIEKKYCGSMIRNKKHGMGRCEYLGGFFYEGNFVNGTRHGFGEMMFQGKAVYKGEWRNGRFTGKGCLYKTNLVGVVKYSGQFVNGKISGYGTMFYESEDKVRGWYSEGKIVGYAIIESGNKELVEQVEQQMEWGKYSPSQSLSLEFAV